MFRRTALLSITLLMLAIFALPAQFVYAGDNSSTSSNTSTTSSRSSNDPIRCGLWAGVNLDATQLNECPRYERTRPSTSTRTTPSPSSTTTQSTAGAYVALGDSVAAGVRLATPTATTSLDRSCGRTAEAYPYVVANSVNLPLIHAACSGATARDLYTRQFRSGPDLPAQLDVAFAGGTPRVITITAGANDIRWPWFLGRCYDSDCARDRYTFLAEGAIRLMGERLENAFDGIASRSGGSPPIVVITGYYDPASPACRGFTPRITEAEVDWISQRVADINATIQGAAAQYSFVRYAQVDFTGHDLCSADPWVQGRTDSRPFHPTAEGQTVMAQSVVNALSR